MHIRRLAAALGATAVLLLNSGAPAAAAAASEVVRAAASGVVPAAASGAVPAVDPITLDSPGQITDEVGALGSRRSEVEAALASLDVEHRVQLYVAYVRNFASRGAQSWADATAEKNGLGQNDLLLAVATRDRQYAVSAATDSGFTEDQIRQVNAEAIEPALRQNDWAGAAIGGADGFAAVLEGVPIPAPVITPGPANPGGGTGAEQFTGSDLLIPVVAVGGAGLAAAYLFSGKRRKRRTAKEGQQTWGGPAQVPLPELDGRAKQLLVETDDAIRTSQEELGFASAQFGEATAEPFNQAVGYAKAEITRAFRLRQQLDDAFPEDDATKRKMLDEIIHRCTQASQRLDAESAAFDRLRQMVANAPAVLANAETAAQQVPEKIQAAEKALAAMADAYAPSAVAAVTGHPREAKDRFQFAAKNLAQARTALEGGDSNTTAVHVRAAEGAVDQAETLADAVLRRESELHEAAGRTTEAVRDMQADLADARGMVSGTKADDSTAGLQGRIGRAETVLAEVSREVNAGRYDPLSVLRRLEEADAALEDALRGAREHEEAERRAGGLLEQALLTARSEVGAARDFITTHRGAIGTQARTRLHEAQRHLEQAAALSRTDAPSALQHAQRADQLGREARRLAEEDVSGYGGYGGGRMGGGINTGMLGGLILGGMLGGGGRGGGGFGGSGGGFSPGSFGGVRTTGRMGGGGRF
ncbi:TPM domain-containing protein [Streptomyces sp. NPDC051940]|uniref:TPM domain-containing protein n=1 Tax=Streptomyces sp. NPDC051940 TaxID=3155675 RepID=UPI00342B77A0